MSFTSIPIQDLKLNPMEMIGGDWWLIAAGRQTNGYNAMTASWAHLPYELLGKISNRIINEVEHVNRVVYDVSSKPPSTIEWE